MLQDKQQQLLFNNANKNLDDTVFLSPIPSSPALSPLFLPVSYEKNEILQCNFRANVTFYYLLE